MRFFQAFEFECTELCRTSSNTFGGSCKESSQNPRKKFQMEPVTLAGKQMTWRFCSLSLSLPGVLCCWCVWFYSFCRLTFSGNMSAPVPKTMWPVNSRAYHSYWQKFLCLLLKILVRIRLNPFICLSIALGHTGCLWVTCPPLVLWAVSRKEWEAWFLPSCADLPLGWLGLICAAVLWAT